MLLSLTKNSKSHGSMPKLSTERATNGSERWSRCVGVHGTSFFSMQY